MPLVILFLLKLPSIFFVLLRLNLKARDFNSCLHRSYLAITPPWSHIPYTMASLNNMHQGMFTCINRIIFSRTAAKKRGHRAEPLWRPIVIVQSSVPFPPHVLNIRYYFFIHILHYINIFLGNALLCYCPWQFAIHKSGPPHTRVWTSQFVKIWDPKRWYHVGFSNFSNNSL